MKLTENQKRIIRTINMVAEHELGETFPPAEALSLHDRDWTHSGDAVPFTLWTAHRGECKHFAGTASCSPRRKALVSQWDLSLEFEFVTAPHAIKLQDNAQTPNTQTMNHTSSNTPTLLSLADFHRAVEEHVRPHIIMNVGPIISGFAPFVGQPECPITEDEICDLTFIDGWNDESREIFEHWSVTDWLSTMLEEHGERVVRLPALNISVWCRTTTGQSISIDWVMEQIAMGDLNIKEG